VSDEPHLIVESLEGPSLEDGLHAVLACDQPCVLDSSAPHPEFGRFSILACEPVEVRAWSLAHSPDAFAGLQSAMAGLPHVKPTGVAPFCGGWIGFLSYEAGRWLERLPDRTGCHRLVPEAWFAFFDSAATYDHFTHRWRLLAVQWPSSSPLSCRPPAAERIARWRERLHRAVAGPRPLTRTVSFEAKADFTRDRYERVVAKAIDYIAAGDIFQVNLAQRFVVPGQHDPRRIFFRLRQDNPCWFGAYLDLPGATVVSASPELYLRLRGRDVLTRPIKGTRPRSTDEALDEALRRELEASPKDRAELAMIIDLERNDLGRVCEYGSVRVLQARALESHPTVHHLVGTVVGRLRSGLTVVDLLRATFPGGSITGAPKIRAMQIIDELEPVPRGVYCGAIGYIGLDGSAEFSVAIRTMTIGPDYAEIHAGGGIVADSVPHAEYDETLAKAAALLRAVGVAPESAGAERRPAACARF